MCDDPPRRVALSPIVVGGRYKPIRRDDMGGGKAVIVRDIVGALLQGRSLIPDDCKMSGKIWRMLEWLERYRPLTPLAGICGTHGLCSRRARGVARAAVIGVVVRDCELSVHHSQILVLALRVDALRLCADATSWTQGIGAGAKVSAATPGLTREMHLQLSVAVAAIFKSENFPFVLTRCHQVATGFDVPPCVSWPEFWSVNALLRWMSLISQHCKTSGKR